MTGRERRAVAVVWGVVLARGRPERRARVDERLADLRRRDRERRHQRHG